MLINDKGIYLNGLDMSEPYSYVRFRWWQPVKLDELKEELEEKCFDVKIEERPGSEAEISLYKDERNELVAHSDTLKASLSTFRGLMTQPGESEPFTERDMELRRIIKDVYPHGRPTPFPWSFSVEPEFEKEKK